MKIEEIQNIIRVGEITEGTRLYSGNKRVAYDYALVLDYDDSLPKGLVNKYLSIVYIFVVDGEVYKIGQTGGKGGLKAAINFYLLSGQDDPGLNRFTINYLIRESLEQGKCVELYFYYEELEERLVKWEVEKAIDYHFRLTHIKFFPIYKQALRGERFAFLIVFAFDRARG